VRSNNYYLIFLSAFLLLGGCLGLMEKAGNVLDGSAFAEKKVKRFQNTEMEVSVVKNKKSEQSIIIYIKNYPMIKLRGTLPDENGNFIFTSLEYLAGNTHGWNEFTMQLLGGGNLVLNNSVIKFDITEKIECIQITQGRIHRYDTRITGDEAVTALRNRLERVLTLTEWMLSIGDAPKNQSLDDFEKYWKPFLMPEMVSSGKRPDGWRQDGDTFERAEDVRWNTSFTERVFPEELWLVRNSGTLLRDWEEALSLIYMQYEWDSILNIFTEVRFANGN